MTRTSKLLRGAVLIAPLITMAFVPRAASASDFMTIPVRWCAIEGTSAVVKPDCVCEDSHTNVLRRRLARTNKRSYLPGCFSVWRSAAADNVENFPIIPDPCDPNNPPVDNSMCPVNPKPELADPDYATKCCPGVTGDMYMPPNHLTLEDKWATLACAEAWNELGVGAVGVTGVNVRRFVDADGVPTNVAGRGVRPFFCSAEAYGQATGGFAAVDNDFLILVDKAITDECAVSGCEGLMAFNDVHETVVGHELGHAITLGHTSNTLMNMSAGVFWQLQKSQDDIDTCPNDIPEPETQCEQIRRQAICHVAGTTTFSFPEPWPPVYTDSFTSEWGNGDSGWLDLVAAGLVDDVPKSQATLFWEVFSPFPATATSVSFEIALDLDSNPLTGGTSSAVGLGVPMPGVELLARVRVDVVIAPLGGARSLETFADLWHYDGAAFVTDSVADSRASEITAFIDSLGSIPNPPEEVPYSAMIALDFDRALLDLGGGTPGMIGVQARLVEVASGFQDLTAEDTLAMNVPVLPQCEVLPLAADSGDDITVSGTDLPASVPLLVFLGAELIGNTTSNTLGEASVLVTIPNDATAGFQPVSLSVDLPDNAISATCYVEVDPGSIVPLTERVGVWLLVGLLVGIAGWRLMGVRSV